MIYLIYYKNSCKCHNNKKEHRERERERQRETERQRERERCSLHPFKQVASQNDSKGAECVVLSEMCHSPIDTYSGSYVYVSFPYVDQMNSFFREKNIESTKLSYSYKMRLKS
jgi:hypothetical protein